MEYRNDIYIGKLIKKIFDEKNITKDQLANAARCSRSNIYNIFCAKSIDIDMLVRISKLLDYPFLEEYFITKPQKTKTQIMLEIELQEGEFNTKLIKDNDL